MMRIHLSHGLRHGAVAIALLAAPACAPRPSAPAPATPRRVIVLSIDALNEARIRSSLPPESTESLRSLMDGGACATSARPAFPSLTAPGHAALWTGAYGDVNGISGNVQPRLPRARHAMTQTTSGFQAAALRAEPVWVTAALQGVRTAGHHATQSPGMPGGGTAHVGDGDSTTARIRQRAAAASASPTLHLVNGYDVRVAESRVITHGSHSLRRAAGWVGLELLPRGDGTVPPLEAAIPVGTRGDSMFVLFTGDRGAYTHIVASGSRSVSRGAAAWPHPAESSPISGRELARHFSASFAITGDGRAFRTHVRLFALAPDASRYMIYLPALAVTASNHESTRRGYDAGADGWVGNSAGALLASGALGRTLEAGGDGVAEHRWLETAELATRQGIAGARWMWTSLAPQLMFDYFAIGDDTDHQFWGLLAADAPGHDTAVAARAQQVRAHAWSLVDARVGAVHDLARASGAAIVLSGDHGMRAYWRRFRPNVALAQAGLAAVDGAGRIIARHSRAISPNGYWISVNRTAWRDGTVAPAEERAVIDSVARVLAAVRDADGNPVVSQVILASAHDSLGLGGPAGGDVYFELARGYYYDAASTGPLTDRIPYARGGHGFPSVSADMHTVLCVNGPGFAPRRVGPARTIDVAPTVLDWLGVTRPASMRGRSLLGAMRPD